MKCPTPCFLCGEICELDDLHFATAFCVGECLDGCQHGLCDECAADYDESES